MKQGSLYETFIQLAALVFAFIVVQATYTTVIRPVAADIQAYQVEQQQVAASLDGLGARVEAERVSERRARKQRLVVQRVAVPAATL